VKTEVGTQGRKESIVLSMMIGEIKMEALTWKKELEWNRYQTEVR
jgi:hypothetical protein